MPSDTAEATRPIAADRALIEEFVNYLSCHSRYSLCRESWDTDVGAKYVYASDYEVQGEVDDFLQWRANQS